MDITNETEMLAERISLLPDEAKMQLIDFLTALQGTKCSSEPQPACPQEAE